MRWRTALFCLLVGGSQITATAAVGADLHLAVGLPVAQREPAQFSARYCAARGTQVTKQQMSAARGIILKRLHVSSGSSASVAQLGGRCIRITLAGGVGQGSYFRALLAIGALVIADSGKISLNTGAFVRIRGTSQSANHSLRPPVLHILLPVGSVKRGSAGAGVDQAGSGTVVFTLTPHAAATWCTFTTHHVSSYAAIVLDNRVISDPMIQSAICSGQTQITGLAGVAQAKMIAAYLNYGALPISFRQA